MALDSLKGNEGTDTVLEGMCLWEELSSLKATLENQDPWERCKTWEEYESRMKQYLEQMKLYYTCDYMNHFADEQIWFLDSCSVDWYKYRQKDIENLTHWVLHESSEDSLDIASAKSLYRQQLNHSPETVSIRKMATDDEIMQGQLHDIYTKLFDRFSPYDQTLSETFQLELRWWHTFYDKTLSQTYTVFFVNGTYKKPNMPLPPLEKWSYGGSRGNGDVMVDNLVESWILQTNRETIFDKLIEISWGAFDREGIRKWHSERDDDQLLSYEAYEANQNIDSVEKEYPSFSQNLKSWTWPSWLVYNRSESKLIRSYVDEQGIEWDHPYPPMIEDAIKKKVRTYLIKDLWDQKSRIWPITNRYYRVYIYWSDKTTHDWEHVLNPLEIVWWWSQIPITNPIHAEMEAYTKKNNNKVDREWAEKIKDQLNVLEYQHKLKKEWFYHGSLDGAWWIETDNASHAFKNKKTHPIAPPINHPEDIPKRTLDDDTRDTHITPSIPWKDITPLDIPSRTDDVDLPIVESAHRQLQLEANKEFVKKLKYVYVYKTITGDVYKTIRYKNEQGDTVDESEGKQKNSSIRMFKIEKWQYRINWESCTEFTFYQELSKKNKSTKVSREK